MLHWEKERDREKERERERECVFVCVYVREREREREPSKSKKKQKQSVTNGWNKWRQKVLKTKILFVLNGNIIMKGKSKQQHVCVNFKESIFLLNYFKITNAIFKEKTSNTNSALYSSYSCPLAML